MQTYANDGMSNTGRMLPRQLLISKKMFAEARAWAKNGLNGMNAKSLTGRDVGTDR